MFISLDIWDHIFGVQSAQTILEVTLATADISSHIETRQVAFYAPYRTFDAILYVMLAFSSLLTYGERGQFSFCPVGHMLKSRFQVMLPLADVIH